MKIEKQQILSLFRKVMTKIYRYLYGVLTKDFEPSLPQERMVSLIYSRCIMEFFLVQRSGFFSFFFGQTEILVAW